MMIEGMIDAHSTDPELYELLATEVPHRANGTHTTLQYDCMALSDLHFHREHIS